MSPRVQCDLHMYSGGPLMLTVACQESIYGAFVASGVFLVGVAMRARAVGHEEAFQRSPLLYVFEKNR